MYEFYQDGNSFFFFTESNALYAVKIALDNEILANEFSDARLNNDFYELSFNIVQGNVDLEDKSISRTIIGIAKAWIQTHNKILFFICSSVDRTAEARMKLFELWARAERDFIEFSKHLLVEHDKKLSHIGTIIRLDHDNLDYFKGSRDQVIQRLNAKK